MGFSVSILSNSPNHFLSSLSSKDAELLQPHIKLVEFPSGAVLYRAEDSIARVYFPYTGIVSFVVGVASGEFVEAGLIGRNSAIGVSAPIDGSIAINEAIVQVAMSGAAIDVTKLRPVATESQTLRHALVRHEEMALGQVQHVAACNVLHNVEQRLARWLLMAYDLLSYDIVPITQDYLSQMLGVHRSSVTLAARRIQEAGIIDYHRGDIRIIDVEALKDVSCECYQAINALFLRVIGWSPNGSTKPEIK